jgi:hypothetical protein
VAVLLSHGLPWPAFLAFLYGPPLPDAQLFRLLPSIYLRKEVCMTSSKSADATPKSSGGKGSIVSPAHSGITGKQAGAKIKLTGSRSASSKR